MICTKPLLNSASFLGITLVLLMAGALATGVDAPRVFASDSGEISVDSQETRPAQEEDQDPEANLPFLFAVFIITWAILFAFVFMISRRQSTLRREIEALRETVLARGKRSTNLAEGSEET